MDAFWGTNSTKPEFIWKSTGLYVKAGKVVEIEVKRELFNIIKVSFERGEYRRLAVCRL